MHSFMRCVTVALALVFVAGGAHAQQKYPTKSIRLIVPFVPGGGTDIVSRALAQKMSETLGQSVIVDNRPGAAGTIGAEIAVRSNPDGYTLIMVSTSYAGASALYQLPYDPVNDITPIIQVGQSAFVVVLNPSVPIKSIKELVAYAKANPGKLNYGSTGTGGITHLATELFELTAGTKMTHVPYKGTGAALTDLLGGQIQLLFGSLPSTVPQVKAGLLRGLAVTTPKRVSALPDMPTVMEAGVPYELIIWYGIWGPKGLPKDIVSLWNREANRIIRLPETRARYEKEGLEPAGGPSEQFREVIRKDIAKLREVVKKANVKTIQ
ncbi:MAG: tripartite tricarboxylate transporter substrate binding protein [Betaproteobacteria bacterium]|nr:tripartite tricarboxylate transporter substrate binding protein [Betaproteobacteria bacterium]